RGRHRPGEPQYKSGDRAAGKAPPPVPCRSETRLAAWPLDHRHCREGCGGNIATVRTDRRPAPLVGIIQRDSVSSMDQRRLYLWKTTHALNAARVDIDEV